MLCVSRALLGTALRGTESSPCKKTAGSMHTIVGSSEEVPSHGLIVGGSEAVNLWLL